MEGGKEAMEQADIVVFGGGSFATALAYVLSKNHHTVTLLTRNEAVAQSINEQHRNPKYLSTFTLPPNVRASTRAEDVVPQARYIVHAVPVQASREYLQRLAPLIAPDTPIISSSKGLHTESLRYMSDIVPEALGRNQPMAFISGPSFAKELMQDVPTAVVVASVDSVTRERVQRLFASPSFRVYTTDDVVGVEIGGALKNVFAIAAGMSEGLGLGTNTLAALVTRGCSEMTRLAVKMGARPDTVSGLSGIGDLMLTCFGSLSRNRTVGKRLGSGESLESILATMEEVAEGVATTPAACKLAEQYGLDLPIIKAVAAILRGDLQAREAVLHLMTLPLSDEKTW